jgi:hypothetical protein
MERNENICDQRIPLQVTEHFKLALERAAKADGRSVNNFIRYVLASALKDEERTAA